MKPDQKNEDAWAEILAHGEVVVAAYEEFLKSSDVLANALPYNHEYVLRRALPKKPGNRRKSDSIRDWLKADRAKIQSDLVSWQSQIREAAKRGELLSRLNLTKDEKRLLGIDD